MRHTVQGEIEVTKPLADRPEDFISDEFDEFDQLASVAASAEANRRKYMIAFDATGSMRTYWTSARTAIYNAVNVIKKRSPVPCVVRVLAYRDKEFDGDRQVELSQYSDDASYLQEFIEHMRCDGGGDEPESIEIPLENALDDPCHQVIMLGDAPGKGQHPEFALASRLGQAKCPVYTLYLKDYCKAAFIKIAKLSGGKAFAFKTASPDVMGDILLTILAKDKNLQLAYTPTTLEGRKYLEQTK